MTELVILQPGKGGPRRHENGRRQQSGQRQQQSSLGALHSSAYRMHLFHPQPIPVDKYQKNKKIELNKKNKCQKMQKKTNQKVERKASVDLGRHVRT